MPELAATLILMESAATVKTISVACDTLLLHTGVNARKEDRT
ncbi:hypothetical protein TC41_3207 [Alicyclobacillus acidocaldarius subsp. acidocaldarius Tc-4-1]|uniref:Uncharacterized protein n=1 Tax=Alicyclobacillus acidocaldarius (strain Tc-4-1) TaxID=1048834 RepID=F8IDP4_ALIAT|nr:hypothetical protein TC41_3207 [Alicyclobacillus acidocaldarius subsp. acidocaldarius Tc-4-1]